VTSEEEGQEQPILSTWIATGIPAEALGCLVALAIIPLVAVAVIVIAGDAKLPDGLQGSTPYFLGTAGLFGGLAAWWYRRNRVRLELVRTPEGLAVRVAGVTVVTTPVELAYGWEKVHLKGSLKTTVLRLGIIKDGQCVLSLSEEWGALLGEPAGWNEGFPRLPTGPVTKHYTGLGGRFVTDLAQHLASPPRAQ
jgi:hypothetical protein